MPRNGRGRYEVASWGPSFESAGRAGRAGRYRAFIPHPIADYEPSLSASTSALSERAGLAVRELNASADDLLPLEGLGRQLLRLEALASSAIEGLEISHRKLARAEALGEGGTSRPARCWVVRELWKRRSESEAKLGIWTSKTFAPFIAHSQLRRRSAGSLGKFASRRVG
jgi:hypothetical protein